MSKAFSIIEIIISVSIILFLSVATFYYFGRANSAEALKKDREAVIGLLEQARSLTVSSKEASVYGVYFSVTEAVLFKGQVYNPTDPNNIKHQFNRGVSVSQVSFADSSNQIVFSRLVGDSSTNGSITITEANSNSSLVINISSTGVIN